MGMPTWWNERRFGVIVHASAATVPAWAPIGQYADWYRSHLSDDLDGVAPHPRPMAEVLAHHRDRWGHIESYDDFVPLLTFDHFDAEGWAGLVREAGAGYSVLVAKHHDGWTWWDAPESSRRLTETGPQRNVLGEYAAACERNDIVFGAHFSLLDWADPRPPDQGYVDTVLHPQVVDLVERYGANMLWGDGEWMHDAGDWKTAELMARVRSMNPEIVIDDRWRASATDVPDGSPSIVRTYEYGLPDDITTGPWELRRGIGNSFGYNRTERAEHHLTGFDIVALLTEVVAKGGNLLLGLGPTADGTIPELQVGPLRDAGTWIRRYATLLGRSAPWDVWGDEDVRYLSADGTVYAIDVSGRGRFPHLTPGSHRVGNVELVGDPAADVDADVPRLTWLQDEDGLHVRSEPRADGFQADRIGIAVYRLELDAVERPTGLFESIPSAAVPVAPLLENASPGDIVQLGDGVYVGPAVVPPGVVLRGLGPDRTSIVAPAPTAQSIVPAAPVLGMGRGARVEHLRVSGQPDRSERFPAPIVAIAEQFATVLGCAIDGVISVTSDDVLIRAISARGVIATNADRLLLSRCTFAGNRWDVGVDLRSGGGHEVESCEFVDHLCALRAAGTTGTTIRGNTIAARWWGVHLDRTEGAHVHGNRVRSTMRAVDVDGGTEAVIDGNAVLDGDSGCIVEHGASGCQVMGNHWERCRIGLLDWDATTLHHQDNHCTDLHEPEHTVVTGP